MTIRDTTAPARSSVADPTVDIVVPVYNEERSLTTSVRRLRTFLDEHLPWPAVITIVDNGSTDTTPLAAERLVQELEGVRLLQLGEKGRGRALRRAWQSSEAGVVAYMDVDLSTSLEALLPLLAPLVSGHSDIAVGSRLARGAKVVRGPKREVISRAYNLLLRTVLGNGFSDAQCGFKALRAEAARTLLPLVADDEWFFDTELLVTAEESGMRVHEVAVDWIDDPDSRVDIPRTIRHDLAGVVRLLRRRLTASWRLATPAPVSTGAVPRALTTFASVGTLSTVVFLVLFFLLRPLLGTLGANALALGLCTLGNTVAHPYVTVPDRGGGGTIVVGVAAAYCTSLAATGSALVALSLLGWHSSLVIALALAAANALAALARFVLLRLWIVTA